jgi:hypothetical protein
VYEACRDWCEALVVLNVGASACGHGHAHALPESSSYANIVLFSRWRLWCGRVEALAARPGLAGGGGAR